MKNKMADSKKWFIVGISVLFFGVASLVAAIVMVSGSQSAARRNTELLRSLALADARERIGAATEALRSVEETGYDDTVSPAAAVLDSLAGARAALAGAGLSGADGRIFEVLEWCRAAALEYISGTSDRRAELSATLDRLYVALASSDSAEEIAGIADEIAAGVAETDRGFAALNSSLAFTQASLRAKAASYFGKNAVLNEAGGSGFPPALVLCGENTLVAVSRARGELLELYFDRPAGEEKLSAEDCAARIADFLAREGLPSEAVTAAGIARDELCGAYFYRPDEEGGGICVGVRWDTGRICYFNAYEYYR